MPGGIFFRYFFQNGNQRVCGRACACACYDVKNSFHLSEVLLEFMNIDQSLYKSVLHIQPNIPLGICILLRKHTKCCSDTSVLQLCTHKLYGRYADFHLREQTMFL